MAALLRFSFAQLRRSEKNQVSHRGLALRELQQEFGKVLIWIDQNMPLFPKISCQE